MSWDPFARISSAKVRLTVSTEGHSCIHGPCGQRVRETGKFSPQMWEPFSEWMSKVHPDAAAKIYEDATHSMERVTEHTVGLWDRYTREYVKVVRRNTAG